MTARRRGPLPRYAVPGRSDLTLPPARVPAADYRSAVETTERIAREPIDTRPPAGAAPAPRDGATEQ